MRSLEVEVRTEKLERPSDASNDINHEEDESDGVQKPAPHAPAAQVLDEIAGDPEQQRQMQRDDMKVPHRDAPGRSKRPETIESTAAARNGARVAAFQAITSRVRDFL